MSTHIQLDDTAEMQLPRLPLYERIGGDPALEALMDEFYRRVLDDEMLAPRFAATDIASLKRRQVLFLGEALGGPARYRGPGMRAAHAGMAIRPEEFDRVASHLVSALGELGVRPEVVEQIVSAVAPLKPEIVGR